MRGRKIGGVFLPARQGEQAAKRAAAQNTAAFQACQESGWNQQAGIGAIGNLPHQAGAVERPVQGQRCTAQQHGQRAGGKAGIGERGDG